MSNAAFQQGALALEEVTISLGEVRKVIGLIEISAQNMHPASTFGLSAICATADLAGDRIDELTRRLDMLMHEWWKERHPA